MVSIYLLCTMCLCLCLWSVIPSALAGKREVNEKLTAAGLTPTPVPEPYFPLEPLCFSGSATHQYFGEHIAVQIQANDTDDLAYFICDIQTTDPSALKTALSNDKIKSSFEKTSTISARHSAILAINGDDFGTHDYGIIIRDGVLLRAKKSTRHLLCSDAQGNLTVITDRQGEKPKTLAEQLLAFGAKNTWEFGPELIRDGEALSLQDDFKLISVRDTRLDPRTAIGQIGPLHYVVIVVDGRKSGYSRGISLMGLQQMFVEAGAKTAFNLDGGGSTTLYFRGEVLNRPSGGRERYVSDILFFR